MLRVRLGQFKIIILVLKNSNIFFLKLGKLDIKQVIDAGREFQILDLGRELKIALLDLYGKSVQVQNIWKNI